MGRCSGQSADFIWQWIHSLVRCLNKNASVKLSLYWNPQVLIFFPQERQEDLQSGLSVSVTATALLWPFLIHKPTQSCHFHPFPYVSNQQRKLGNPPPPSSPDTEQVIYSEVGSQLSPTQPAAQSDLCVSSVSHCLWRKRKSWRGLPSQRHVHATHMIISGVRVCSCVGRNEHCW